MTAAGGHPQSKGVLRVSQPIHKPRASHVERTQGPLVIDFGEGQEEAGDDEVLEGQTSRSACQSPRRNRAQPKANSRTTSSVVTTSGFFTPPHAKRAPLESMIPPPGSANGVGTCYWLLLAIYAAAPAQQFYDLTALVAMVVWRRQNLWCHQHLRD
jgi:hypothetical protein